MKKIICGAAILFVIISLTCSGTAQSLTGDQNAVALTERMPG